MLNPIYIENNTVLIFENYAAMENRDPTKVGAQIVTNIPGTCGHNYATWEVTNVIPGAPDSKALIRAKRIA